MEEEYWVINVPHDINYFISFSCLNLPTFTTFGMVCLASKWDVWMSITHSTTDPLHRAILLFHGYNNYSRHVYPQFPSPLGTKSIKDSLSISIHLFHQNVLILRLWLSISHDFSARIPGWSHGNNFLLTTCTRLFTFCSFHFTFQPSVSTCSNKKGESGRIWIKLQLTDRGAVQRGGGDGEEEGISVRSIWIDMREHFLAVTWIMKQVWSEVSPLSLRGITSHRSTEQRMDEDENLYQSSSPEKEPIQKSGSAVKSRPLCVQMWMLNFWSARRNISNSRTYVSKEHLDY